MRKQILFVLLLSCSFGVGFEVSANVRNSPHNLSASGRGQATSADEQRLCFFCHAPHRPAAAGGVAWNRRDSTVTYIPYDSATLSAKVGQPTGASKLCLSCHDGTVAMGNVRSKQAGGGFRAGSRFMPAGRARLGVDLRDDHPISFSYDAALVSDNPELVPPSALTEPVELDTQGQMQCTSCHTAHDNTYGNFLVTSTRRSELCLSCHDRFGWNTSVHATSGARWSGQDEDPWPYTEYDSVSENACANCHVSHGAGSSSWLLREAKEEDNCLACHNGEVAATDIKSVITKGYTHPVDFYTDVHSPIEEATLSMTKHVTCTDCHNPHQVTEKDAVAPVANGRLKGVRGVSASGLTVEEASFEYEICFKCHAQYSMTDPPVARQIVQNDKSLQFALNNPSFHPIQGIGVNTTLPSLIYPEYTPQSIIYCTDCHANDSGPGAGGSGPAGPHGSNYQFLLERNYTIFDGSQGSDATPYDICYKCHNIESILNDESFKSHDKHIRGESTACSTCHDPHGISSTQGNAVNNSNLINFDITTVLPDSNGRLEFIDQGDFTGECYLTCHGTEHSPERY